MPYRDPNANRDRARERRREGTARRQDISKRLWPIKNPGRRKAALARLRKFAETYFPEKFNRPWSKDHLEVIAIMEEAARKGGIFPVAMPRGSGKTALCIALCLWAVLGGLRDFVLLVGASKAAALELLDSIKKEIETNQLLADDFPREIGPLKLLVGESRRAAGQKWNLSRTHVAWKQCEICFAEVPQAKSAGAVIRVAGITGRIRGAIFTTRAGRQIGPNLVVADDPQDDQSAKSTGKTDFREKVLLSTVKGLARTGVRIGLVIPCTVIRKEDLADRLMDRARHPDLRSKRTKMLYSLPSDLKLWDEYARIFADDRAAGGDGSLAADFYRRHRAAMDAGAEAAWEHNFEPGEVSAVEHAMRWYLFNRQGFYSECQQEPLEEHQASGRLEVADIFAKLNGRPRGQVAQTCRWITAMVDVHERLLYYNVAAWEPNFTGYRIDWGTLPEQPDRHFAMDSCRKPLAAAYPNRGKEGAVYAGLEALFRDLLGRTYTRDDGAALHVDRLGVDTGFDQAVVANVIRALGRGQQIAGTKGVGLGPAARPFTAYRPEAGAQIGRHWRKSMAPKIQLLVLNYDANRWKSFYRDRVKVPLGDPGAFSFFGTRPQDEQLYAEHHAVELPTPVSGPWGDMEQWRMPPPRPDQHLWDCAVGCCVLANDLGAKLPEWERPLTNLRPKQPRKAVSYL